MLDRVVDDRLDQLGTRWQVLEYAGHLARASTPASVLPSTNPAFSSIGVLAAITTCDQVSSLPCRISSPSLIIDRQVIFDIFLNFARCVPLH